MPHALSKVYVHMTFSTKERYPFIDDSVSERLWEYLGGICKGMECQPVRIGGCADHVHILCLLSQKVTQVKLLEEVKKQSSRWIKTVDAQYSKFYWQEGYGIFSVNPSEVDVVVDYIINQKTHHQKRSFKNEFLAFLKKYNIEYDERYIWD